MNQNRFALNKDESVIEVDTSNAILLLIENLWQKILDGITFTQIENLLFFILFIRFIILTLRYNLKTSFYITCIGTVAGYLWYRHLVDVVFIYRIILVNLPVLSKLGTDATQTLSAKSEELMFWKSNSSLDENVAWYNPGIVLYNGIKKGILSFDPETRLKYYIDPISMMISILPKSIQIKILPFYYQLYTFWIPQSLGVCRKYWNEFSGVLTYVFITRIGKKYCPYLIRWHWSCIILIGILEQFFAPLMSRIYIFQTQILLPQQNPDPDQLDLVLNGQITFLSAVLNSFMYLHIGFIIFSLFHAIWGQYFYVPFIAENIDFHVGPRPTDSIYSGGNTAWQNPEEKTKDGYRWIPKVWYGWFGRGTKNKSNLISFLQTIVRKILKRIKKIMKS